MRMFTCCDRDAAAHLHGACGVGVTPGTACEHVAVRARGSRACAHVFRRRAQLAGDIIHTT